MGARIKDFLALKFLLIGREIFSGDTPEVVEQILKEKGSAFVFIRISRLDSLWLDYFARLKDKDEQNIKLIVLTDIADRQFLQTLLLLDIAGLISASLDEENVYKRLYEIVNSESLAQNEKRAHQRVSPENQDNITITITNPNLNKNIIAKVINLSIGGIALKLTNTAEVHGLVEKMIIENAQMRFNQKIAMTSLKIIMIKETLVGAQFLQPSNYFLNLLGRYLLDRLTRG